MWRFLLRFRLILWLLRFVIFPLLVFSLAVFVFVLIGVSLYALVIVKTLKGIEENPYLYVPLLLVEIFITVSGAYALMVYINKIWKHKKWR